MEWLSHPHVKAKKVSPSSHFFLIIDFTLFH